MQVLFVLGLELALKKFDTRAPNGLTRTGLQDDRTFVGSANALDRCWNELERGWPQTQRLRVWCMVAWVRTV